MFKISDNLHSSFSNFTNFKCTHLWPLSVESNIGATVLFNLLNSLQKKDKILHMPRTLSLFLNSFNKLNKT